MHDPVTLPWELSSKPPPDVITGYKWELYNVMEDPTQNNDLGPKMPDKLTPPNMRRTASGFQSREPGGVRERRGGVGAAP